VERPLDALVEILLASDGRILQVARQDEQRSAQQFYPGTLAKAPGQNGRAPFPHRP
jgi:hypothetical protein